MIREAETPFGIKTPEQLTDALCVCHTNKDKECAALLSPGTCPTASFWMRDLRGVNLIPHEFKWQYGGYYKKCFTAGVAFFRYSCAATACYNCRCVLHYGGAVAAAV